MQEIIADEPVLVDKLKDIFRHPSYYTGYYLKNIPCTPRIKGSVPTKYNHSSIIKHFGPSASWTITENSVRLMERQQ